MRIVKRLAAVAAVAGVAVLTAVGPALADPLNTSLQPVTPKETDVVGVGSDTIEYPLDQLMIDYQKAHPTAASFMYSWNATNPSTGNPGDSIVTKAGCTAIARPDGSSAGITALTQNQKTADGKHFCIDFARSSRARQSTDPPAAAGGVLFVALAGDAVTYATQSTTNAPSNLTAAQLNAIYTCTATKWNQVGGTSTGTIKPFLPQTGSGTRAFFLSAIGVTTPGSCVNSSVQENEWTNTLLHSVNAIAPFSVAKWIAEKFHSATCFNTGCTPNASGQVCAPTSTQNLFGCKQTASSKLNSINGTAPTTGTGGSTTINPSFTPNFMRTVYDVVRYTTGTPDHIPGYMEKFFASSTAATKGWICNSTTGKNDLKKYGFLNTPLCGVGS